MKMLSFVTRKNAALVLTICVVALIVVYFVVDDLNTVTATVLGAALVIVGLVALRAMLIRRRWKLLGMKKRSRSRRATGMGIDPLSDAGPLMISARPEAVGRR